MIRIINRQRKIPVDIATLKTIIDKMITSLGYQDFDIGVFLTTNKTIQRYNKKYRHKDAPTDILSFPYHSDIRPGQRIVALEPEDKNLGDIIISLEYVRDHAPEWGRNFHHHLVALLAHGIAHLLNYDHQTEEEYNIMQKVEEKLLRSIKKKDIKR